MNAFQIKLGGAYPIEILDEFGGQKGYWSPSTGLYLDPLFKMEMVELLETPIADMITSHGGVRQAVEQVVRETSIPLAL